MYSEKKFYLTKEGLKKAKEEYKNLSELRILKSKGEAPELLHSEELNPEYMSFLEDVELLENRISELDLVLKNYEMISLPPKDKRKEIHIGAKVSLEIDGEKDEFEIVGTFEANPSLGKISDDSPVGKLLLGRKEGEEFVMSSLIKTSYKIRKIKY